MDKAYIRMLKAYTMNTLEQIFPKARAELIRLLFADSTRSLHLREIARLSGLALGTIQREVAKMSAAELIAERRDGNRLYFSANTQNPIFHELRGIALKTTGLKSQLSQALHELGGIQLAFAYGSFATGTPQPGSDIDLFIIGTIGLRKLAPRLSAVANTMDREINPTVISADSYTKKRRANDAYINNVTNGEKLWIIGNNDELRAMA